MKKIISIIILLFTCTLFLTSCEKKEGRLIELTSEELVANITKEALPNMVFAIWNSKRDNADEFMKSLKSVVNNANINIYYIDYQNISINQATMLFLLYDYNVSYNSYFVLENNDYVVEGDYSDFKTLYNALKNYSFKDEIEYVSKEKKLEYIENAKKLYNEGQIGQSKEFLNLAYTLDEAKEFHKNSSYYKLLEEWERFEFDKEDNNYATYYAKQFPTLRNYYFEVNKTGKFEGFEKPYDISDYSKVYYYIKDNHIYTSSSEKGKYKKTYEIVMFDDKNLELKDLKTKKVEKYVRRY